MATAKDVLKKAEEYTEAGAFDKAEKFYNAIVERMSDSAEAKQAKAGLDALAAKKKAAETGADFDDLEGLWQESVKNITPEDKLEIKKKHLASENPSAFAEKPKRRDAAVQPKAVDRASSQPHFEKDYSYQTRMAFKNDNAGNRPAPNDDWQYRPPHKTEQHKPHFVVWKLVSGILSIIFCMIVIFQSCAAGVYNTLSSNGEVSGTAGVFVAIFMLAAGIVSIASRKSSKNGGNIATAIIFFLAAIFGFANAGSYADLNIWSAWCLICGILAVVAAILNKVVKA